MGTPGELPEGPARCIACRSQRVRIVVVDGHRVWLCPQHEAILARPAGVATGSAGRVIA